MGEEELHGAWFLKVAQHINLLSKVLREFIAHH